MRTFSAIKGELTRQAEDKKTQSEIVKKKPRTDPSSEDPFQEAAGFNFKKSKSDQKVVEEVPEEIFEESMDQKKDMFEQENREHILSGKRDSRIKDDEFDFDDNFGDFGKKKTPKTDFNFAFEDQFAEQPKPAKVDDFKFEFAEEEDKTDKDGQADPFQQEQIDTKIDLEHVEESVRVEPRPSENLEFEDPFDTEIAQPKQPDFDIFEKNSDRRRGSHADTVEDVVHNSAGRKK